ncbi:MAG TPA: hypothetical protein VIJ25_15820 [Methylococcales bacterium]|jgi:hypothetical protein
MTVPEQLTAEISTPTRTPSQPPLPAFDDNDLVPEEDYEADEEDKEDEEEMDEEESGGS